MKKLIAIILIFALALPLLTACAKPAEPTSSSSGSSSEPANVEKLTADEYFASPIEFDEITASFDRLYYPENASESDQVVFEVATVDENWRINGTVPNPYGLALYGGKLEIVDGDKTRVIYDGDIKPFLVSLSQRKEKGDSDIWLINDMLVFPAVTDDGYEIRYAYIHDGESRLAAKSESMPYKIYAVSNHEFVWQTTNYEYFRVYRELKESHPKEQDAIFDVDDNTATWEIIQKEWEFQQIYKVYPAECHYIDVISGATASAGIETGSDMELFTPFYSRWWLDYLPEE